MSPQPPRTATRQFKKRCAITALACGIRLIKTLPRPVRERVLDRAIGGVTSDLPAFTETLRLVEMSGGIPVGQLWQQRLLTSNPQLRAVRTRDIASDSNGRVRARLYLPPTGQEIVDQAFVWVHGGAFILGGLDQKEAHWPSLELAAAGIPVLSVDYRLAVNGTHYPAPQDDVVNAWLWAVEHSDQLGVRPDRLHIGGASAGACLVASAVVRLRSGELPLPASMYLAYPVLEGEMSPAEDHMAAGLGVPGLPDDDWVSGMFRNWAGSASWNNPQITPARADPAGFPPTYILTCGQDTLRRSSEPFAERLRVSGTKVWHDLFADSRHAPLDRPETTDGQRAVLRLRTWLTGGVAAMED